MKTSSSIVPGAGIAALASLLPSALGAPTFGPESHEVSIINNCGSGRGVFLYQGNPTPQTSATVSGPLYGGVAYLEGGPGGCGGNGVGCGTVEFSLINPGTDGANTQNSINYSLQAQGDHTWKYPMNFRYTGSDSACPAAPGACTGPTACPGAFTGSDTTNGTPVNCVSANQGIEVTFC